jgi:putative flippase GtrA
MQLKRLYNELPLGQKQFIKFSFVGGIGFLVDAGTFFVLTHYFGLGLRVARIPSSLVFGMTTTFFLNRYLTFRGQRDGSMFRQYLRFAAANIIGNLLNVGTHVALVGNVALVHRIPLLGIVAGTFVGLIFNFTGSKYFVFRQAKPST